jgi:hypothetical protein
VRRRDQRIGWELHGPERCQSLGPCAIQAA